MCSSDLIAAFFATLRWIELKLRSACVAFIFAMLTFIALAFVSGFVALIIAIALSLLAVMAACFRFSAQSENQLWHRAVKRFREDTKSSHPDISGASLEELWQRSCSGRMDDVDAFFRAAIHALYSCPPSNNLSFPRKFRVVRTIRTLLLRALSQLRR